MVAESTGGYCPNNQGVYMRLTLYALNALMDPREVAEIETHLQQCAVCSTELEELNEFAAPAKKILSSEDPPK